MKNFNFLSGLLALALCAFSACSQKSTSEEDVKTAVNNFLSISDIHFNPFYDPSLTADLEKTDAAAWDTVFAKSKIDGYGYYGWKGAFYDTGYKLFKSALAEMKSANSNPDFITINGDFLAHSFESNFQTFAHTMDTAALHNFVIKTLDYIVNSIAESFPNTTLFPTLGNNDSFCGDYEVQTPGSFLTRSAPIWQKHLSGLIDPTAFNTTYKKGGYYIAESPVNKKHKVISLNTVMLSQKYMKNQNFCGQVPDPAANKASAEAQFTWLKNQLAKAKQNQEKVWLMYHIPPGLNAFSSYVSTDTANCYTDPYYYYQEAYNERFLALVDSFQTTIAAQLGGHTHMDNFIVINGDKNPNSFVHISPAISPVYYNNPGFLEYTYDTQAAMLKDYTVHGFENIETAKTPNWVDEYTFSSTYGQSELTPQSLKVVYESFKTNASAKQHYIDYYVVEDTVNSSIDDANWPNYYCAFGNQTAAEYKACVCGMRSGN